MAYSVMIVDDSDTIRTMLKRALSMTKLPIDVVVEAENGLKALELLGNSWIDIVLTDIHMPGMGGIELIDKMSGDPELRDIPVVIVSTEGSTKRIEDLKRKGVKGYLRKPFTPERIRDTIVDILGGW